ncbi:hypothetical protein C8R45DRAFT_1090556 [Mycena sanguinolenta]|nr:hypothetical protein C8R45DRAFT_1090556 [Mycena sanguinolenta]
MSLPLPALDTLTGCLLIGTWASSLLYMLEIFQSVYYFQHFAHDDWKSKTLVTFALAVDSLSLIGEYICIYEYTIAHAVDLEYLATVHWPVPLYGFTAGVLGALVQAFLLFRYWRFTQKTVIAIFLALAITISPPTQFGSLFTASLMLTLYTSLKDRQKLGIPMAFWLLTELVVDAGIASVLLWEFRKAKEILIKTPRCTDSALDRVTAVTIQSGAAAATLAGGGLMAYFTAPKSNLPLAILYSLGHVYVITLLSNLNARKSGSSLSTTRTSSGPGTWSLTLSSWATDEPRGTPDVHHTVHPPFELSVLTLDPKQDGHSHDIEQRR